VLLRSSNPGELARKISQAEKGLLQEEEFEVEPEDETDELDDERPRRAPLGRRRE
jgi:hypothetical protein